MIPFPILKTPGGEELVVVPRAEYERLATLAAEAEEDADDLRTYDAVVAELGDNPDWMPPELSALLLKHMSRLGAIRRWRGLSLDALAAKAAISTSELGDFEAGRRAMNADIVARLASALSVPLDWLN